MAEWEKTLALLCIATLVSCYEDDYDDSGDDDGGDVSNVCKCSLLEGIITAHFVLGCRKRESWV